MIPIDIFNDMSLKPVIMVKYLLHFQRENHVVFVLVVVSPQIPGVQAADVAQGETATLACLVSSFPRSNITWRYKSQLLFSDNKKYEIIDSNYTLLVKNASFKDAGDYECEANNELGMAVASAKLTVGCEFWLNFLYD